MGSLLIWSPYRPKTVALINLICPREKARIPTRVQWRCPEEKFQTKVVVTNPISLNRSLPGDIAYFPLWFAIPPQILQRFPFRFAMCSKMDFSGRFLGKQPLEWAFLLLPSCQRDCNLFFCAFGFIGYWPIRFTVAGYPFPPEAQKMHFDCPRKRHKEFERVRGLANCELNLPLKRLSVRMGANLRCEYRNRYGLQFLQSSMKYHWFRI